MRAVNYIILLMCLKVIHAKIRIDVAANDQNDVTVNYSGIDKRIATNEDLKAFKITNRSLMSALKKHYGRKPNNFYLKSPTPWGDLYEKYNWEQVTRTLTIKSSRVKQIDKRPVIVMSEDFENYSTNKTLKVNTGISQSVENTITTTWSTSNELTVGQEIEYDVNVIFAKVSGTTSISYTSTWGKSVDKTETVTIGATTSVETELGPGQAATAVLSANRGSIELEIVYVSSLRGEVAVNFKKPYNGHHFLSPSIGTVMKAGDLSNVVTAVETINIGIYMDSSLKVYDKATGLPL